MNRIMWSLLMTVSLQACQNSNEKAKSTAGHQSSADSTGHADWSGCYQMIVKTDTAKLQIEVSGEHPGGRLFYHHAEKDNNDGRFTGQWLNDSTLLVHYTFRSEGVESVRQLVFRRRDQLILQGYGEEHQRHDTAFLRDPALVVFDTKHPFRPGCN